MSNEQETRHVATDGGIGRLAEKHGINLVTPDQWDAKGYPMPADWGIASDTAKEDWAGLYPRDQRTIWWMKMSGGSMSDMSTAEDLRGFILNGGKHVIASTQRESLREYQQEQDRRAALQADVDRKKEWLAQQSRAPGKMFSRSDIIAILRGQYALTHDSHIKDCITIFENLE